MNNESSGLEQELQRVEADERRIKELQRYKRRTRVGFVLAIGLVAAVIGGAAEWGVNEMAALLAIVLIVVLVRIRVSRRQALERRTDRELLNSAADEE